MNVTAEIPVQDQVKYQVDQEIKDYLEGNPKYKDYPYNGKFHYLNNFILRVINYDDGESNYRRSLLEAGGSPIRRVFRREKRIRESLPLTEKETIQFTSKFLESTPTDFIRDLDRAIAETGLNRDELTKLWKDKKADAQDYFQRIISEKQLNGYTLVAKSDNADEEIYREMFDQLFPAYIKLREMGYNHHDLTV